MDEERDPGRQLKSEPCPGLTHVAPETSFAIPEGNSYRVDLLALLGFSLLTLLMIYPLSLHLAEALQDTSDSLLNLWITNGQAHRPPPTLRHQHLLPLS
jgi:hypothetical protein